MRNLVTLAFLSSAIPSFESFLPKKQPKNSLRAIRPFFHHEYVELFARDTIQPANKTSSIEPDNSIADTKIKDISFRPITPDIHLKSEQSQPIPNNHDLNMMLGLTLYYVVLFEMTRAIIPELFQSPHLPGL